MKKPLVLSLFPGADLLGMAFEAEGFCVVRGPDALLGGDIRGWSVPEGRFDGIIGGPPCKSFSVAIASRGGPEAALEGNLIPEFERIVSEAKPLFFLMENVPQAPIPTDALWSEVLDAWEFGASQHRKRRFSSSHWIGYALQRVPENDRHPDPWPTVTATEHKCSAGSNERTMRQRAGRKVGRRMSLEEVNVAMGLPLDWETPALKQSSAYAVRGNGVPLQLGKAVASAIWGVVFEKSQ